MAQTPVLNPQDTKEDYFLSRRFHTLGNLWSDSRQGLGGGKDLNPGSLVDRISLWLTISAFLVAIGVTLAAPFLAFSWVGRPFPGFLVEQTGVVNDQDGINWSGRGAGIDYPQRVTAIDGHPVGSPQEMQAALDGLGIGRLITVQTTLPDGLVREYNNIVIRTFPQRDLNRLFWLPYISGIAFLLLGGWVFLIRGGTRPARAFAFISVSVSVSITLLFDLVTTHALTWLWTIAIALVGGSLFSLAALFPQEIAPIRHQPWIRFLPYLVSLVLAFRGLVAIHDLNHPWRYIDAWGLSYRFMAAGILVFLGMMVYRLRTNLSPVARQQARIILWGSLLSFLPLVIWLAAPLFDVYLIWNAGIYLPLLLIFPLTIAIAILRYRLWDIDVLINRTLVYSALTILLGLVYVLCVLLFESLFRPFTRHNQMAAVASTLAIVALFNPLRQRLQAFIDALFYRRKYDAAKTLAAFGASLRDEVDLTRLTSGIEQTIWETMQPSAVHTWLNASTGYRVHLAGVRRLPAEWQNLEIPFDDPLIPALRYASGAVELDRLEVDSPTWRKLLAARVKLILPLVSHGELIGWISLGARLSERDYSADDRTLLSNLASQAGPAVRIAQMVRKEQAEALERERLEHELDLARVIQLALLPKELPRLTGWQVDTHYQPARAVGGDFYDFIPLDNGRLGVVIGDVAGKGVPAALLMATTRSVLHAIALQGLPPGQVLRQVNNQLEVEVPDQMFITCLYAIIDLNTGRMSFANAGHNLPFRHLNTSVDELRARGMPLGLLPEMNYEENEAVLEPGVTLMLISDGLVEAHNPEGKMFGSQPLRELIINEDGCKRRLVDCTLDKLSEFTGKTWEQEDDITMVVLHRDGVGS